jgi:hypothetical protein
MLTAKEKIMLRLSASLSKKVPQPQVQFSSISFSASIEQECADMAPDNIQAQMRKIYFLLNQAVDEQIAAVHKGAASTGTASSSRSSATATSAATARRAPANGNGRRVYISDAQKRAIHSISKGLGVTIDQVLSEHGIADINQLSIRDASTLIDQLKARQNGDTARR